MRFIIGVGKRYDSLYLRNMTVRVWEASSGLNSDESPKQHRNEVRHGLNSMAVDDVKHKLGITSTLRPGMHIGRE